MYPLLERHYNLQRAMLPARFRGDLHRRIRKSDKSLRGVKPYDQIAVARRDRPKRRNLMSVSKMATPIVAWMSAGNATATTSVDGRRPTADYESRQGYRVCRNACAIERRAENE